MTSEYSLVFLNSKGTFWKNGYYCVYNFGLLVWFYANNKTNAWHDAIMVDTCHTFDQTNRMYNTKSES